MAVDVSAETRIARPRAEVARFAMEPLNETRWIGGIRAVQVEREAGLRVGSRVARAARFLGRSIEYVNEVVELDPDAKLGMRSVKAPFPMRVTYAFADDGGATKATIRVEGDPGKYYGPFSPLLSFFVSQAIKRDLRNLKRLLESESVTP